MSGRKGTAALRGAILAIAAASLVPACGGGGGGPALPSNEWTWISGSNFANEPGNYGTRGVPANTNVPGGRQGAMGWTGIDGRFWLFGGLDNSVTPSTFFNDLWVWDGLRWTWIAGSNNPNEHGVYGTQGVPDPANKPGGRTNGRTWVDAAGNLWLFGGSGYASPPLGRQFLNDLWRFDGTNWTWIAGADVIGQAGTYGTQGVPDPANVPGARAGAMAWKGSGNDAWIFGGNGYGVSASGNGMLSDLWRWDGTNWTWIAGPTTINDVPAHGTKGVPSGSNTPGGRSSGAVWRDAVGDLWLFGGLHWAGGSSVMMNDLWRWDGTNWTWMAGTDQPDAPGVYGTQGVPDPANVPGGRQQSFAWIDSAGDFWLFGGGGQNGFGSFASLNDLWRFDGTNWTWVRGSMGGSQYGSYGARGISLSTNQPGSRAWGVAWQRNGNTLWLFGGAGWPEGGALGNLNDLWRYRR